MAESSSATATATATATEDATRGKPYYEKLRAELKTTLEKKRELDKTMATIEQSIARAENSYLEETSAAGNIIKGFDNYIKASASSGGGASTGGGTATRRKGGVNEQDRIFSGSSVSWMMRDSPTPVATSATPSEGATPAGTSTSARNTPASTAGVASGPKVGTKTKKKTAGDRYKEKEKDKEKEPTKNKNKEKDGDKEKELADVDGERPAKRGKVSWGRD